MLCLASAHTLVHIDYGTFVGNAIEKTALEALDWAFSLVAKLHLHILKLPLPLSLLSDVSSFSSALNYMSTVSVPKILGGRAFAIVEGAPETIKKLLTSIPDS